MTDASKTVNMSEALARSIRDELRQYNDDNAPVLLLVRKLVSDLAAAREKIAKLELENAQLKRELIGDQ